jgi:3-methyladenine DNA glycosylase/8-oxoguanine DNA glycosylase
MLTLAVQAPIDLRRTLAPVGLAWSLIDAEGWWRAFRTPEGAARLRVRRVAEGVEVRGWGHGGDWALERAGRLVGMHDDSEGFDPSAHPVVARLHRTHAGIRIGKTGLVFEALVHAVIGQKVTGKEASLGLRGLGRMFSEPAPGPGPRLMLPPDPERLASAPYHLFHELGIEKRRADVVRKLAHDAERLDRLASEPVGHAERRLLAYTGVGPWTVAETLVVSHGHADAVSVGDFHLKHLVAWHLAGEERGTDERMLELLEPFRPHRARAVRLVELAGPYPRRGPRMPVRSFSAF